MYRPKDLKNPFGEGGHMSGVVNAEVKEYAWEAGADAMLEGLIKNNQLDHIEVRGRKCKMVFIPDEEKVGA